MKNQAIGIFDSGIGGLTVAHAINQLLPNERLIYFGDTAHLPYGDKSPDSIQYFTKKITEFLLLKQCKVIIIACNSASSWGLNSCIQAAGRIKVLNVVDPIVSFIQAQKNIKKVGVIGTRATISSNIYERKIMALNPYIEVVSYATPLLAPMIEEGFIDNNISKSIIRNYLSIPQFESIDSLVLGCTHYPLIKDEVSNFFNQSIHVLDTANIVAHSTQKYLADNDLLNDSTAAPQHEFHVSDYTQTFEKSTHLFFGTSISLKHTDIWNQH